MKFGEVIEGLHADEHSIDYLTGFVDAFRMMKFSLGISNIDIPPDARSQIYGKIGELVELDKCLRSEEEDRFFQASEFIGFAMSKDDTPRIDMDKPNLVKRMMCTEHPVCRWWEE